MLLREQILFRIHKYAASRRDFIGQKLGQVTIRADKINLYLRQLLVNKQARSTSMEIGGKLYHSWNKESNLDLGELPDDWDVRVSEDNRVYFLE